MTTINELVTRLTFKQDKAGIRAYEAGLTGISKTAAKVAASSAVSFEKMTAKNRKNFGSMGKLMERVMAGSFGKIFNAGSKAFMGLESRFAKLRSTMGKGLQATVKLHGLDKETRKVNDLYGKLMKTAGLLTGGLTAGAVAKSTFTAGGEYEMQMARLNTIFGEKASKDIYTQMQKFAASTPFEMPDLVEFIASTQGAGFKMTKSDGTLDIEKLTSLGDLASASGKGLPELSQAMISANRGLANMMDNFVGLAGKVEDGGITATMFDRTTGKTSAEKIGEDDPNKQAKILDFFVRGGQRGGITGGMERMSQTLPGKLSALRDAVKNLQTQFYLGFQGNAHQFLDKLAQFVEKATPKMKELGVQVGIFIKHDLPKYLEAIKKLLPWIGTGLAVMYAHTVGITTLKFALWLWNAEKAMRGLGFATAIFNGAIALIPTIIGGIVLAVAAFGADFVYWMNTGESMILKFTERWPGVNQAIESAYEAWRIFYYALQIGFENIGAWFGNLIGDFVQGFKDWRQNAINTKNLIVEAFTLVGDSIKGVYDWFVALHDKMVGFFNALAEKFPLLKSVADSVDGLLNRVLGGGDNNGLNSDTPSASDLAGAANPMAADLVKNARAVRNTAGYCLEAVAKMHNMTFGQNARHLATRHAADAASIIAKSDKFTEIKVTKDMLTDPKYQKLLHGATAIYNRQSGFSPVSGHIEVFDTVSQRAFYGSSGKGDPLSSRTEKNLRNARIFVPKENIKSQMPSAAPAPAGGGKGGSTITVQQNFNGPAQPNAVKRATQDGVTQALNKAAAGSPKPKAVG